MKKLLPLLALAVMYAGFSSCYKERTCSCVTTDDYGNGPETSTYSFTIKSNKPEASLACNAADVSYSSSAGYSTETKCSLK